MTSWRRSGRSGISGCTASPFSLTPGWTSVWTSSWSGSKAAADSGSICPANRQNMALRSGSQVMFPRLMHGKCRFMRKIRRMHSRGKPGIEGCAGHDWRAVGTHCYHRQFLHLLCAGRGAAEEKHCSGWDDLEEQTNQSFLHTYSKPECDHPDPPSLRSGRPQRRRMCQNGGKNCFCWAPSTASPLWVEGSTRSLWW